MKQIWIGLVLLALMASDDSTAGEKSPSALRVAFWNIQWFPGRRPEASPGAEQKQIDAVQRDIAVINPDVIGMEEVRDFSKATLALASLPGMKVDVVSNFPPREGQNVGQQVAIASRFQPMSAWVEQWRPHGALVPPRGFAFAAYEIAPHKLLLVYTVHLKSNRGEIHENIFIREECIHQLIDHIAAMNNAYGKLGRITWVIGGDFNTAPDDPRFVSESTVRSLTELGFNWCWKGIPFNQRISLPADKFFPAACFDHIFFLNASLASVRVSETTKASSDHRAIVAELRLSQ